MNLWNIVTCTVTNKCPRCHEGRVFEVDNPFNWKQGLKMNKNCPNCNMKFEREVGYFYGAMYVSYALQAGLLFLLYGLNNFWWNFSPMVLVIMVITSVFALFPVTFRWSRIIWISSFTPFDDSFAKKATRVP